MIEFVHVPRLRFEIFLLPEYLPQFPTIPFTFVQDAKARRCIFFQPGFPLAYLPVCRQLPAFEGKVVPLVGLTCRFEGHEPSRKLRPLLIIGMSLRFELRILVSRICQTRSTELRR